MRTTIYIYGNLDFLGKSAAAKRMMYYAKALATKEVSVYLINCSHDQINQENCIEMESGIYVLQTKAPTSSLFGSLLFLRRLFSFSKKNSGSDAFIIYPQAYFFLEFWTVFYMIFLKGRKVFYELNEVKKHYTFLYKSNSSSKIKAFFKTAIHSILFVVMDTMMRFYTGLLCISTNIQTYGATYNENTVRIPILTNPRLKIEPSAKVFAIEEHFNIGFSGSIVPDKENLLEFIEVINQVIEQGLKVRFNLCGIVTEKNLQQMIAHCTDKNTIKYYGNLNERDLSSFLKQQDLLVVPRGNTLQNKYGFSTKLSDYLNHKKVILVTNISDNGLFIKDGINGFIVEPNDSKLMYEKLTYIIKNFEVLEKKIIDNAMETSKNSFDYRLYSDALLSFLTR